MLLCSTGTRDTVGINTDSVLKEPSLVYRLVKTIKHYDTLINLIIKKAKDIMRAPQRHLDGGQRVFESHPGLEENCFENKGHMNQMFKSERF